MAVTNVKWTDPSLPPDQQTAVLIEQDGGRLTSAGLGVAGDVSSITDGPARRGVQAWIDLGNMVQDADPAPLPPTDGEIYDQVIKNQKVLKAFVLAINDGTLVPGANVSGAALKATIKAKM